MCYFNMSILSVVALIEDVKTVVEFQELFFPLKEHFFSMLLPKKNGRCDIGL